MALLFRLDEVDHGSRGRRQVVEEGHRIEVGEGLYLGLEGWMQMLSLALVLELRAEALGRDPHSLAVEFLLFGLPAISSSQPPQQRHEPSLPLLLLPYYLFPITLPPLERP